ncbi:MAG: efflux RND transporter periplasmic adaptor subunit [candidate division KSB1 bacterium]|nr:efflux RND transporter periplasmic adaptor subunit [candidate division KSB1 bacterium]
MIARVVAGLLAAFLLTSCRSQKQQEVFTGLAEGRAVLVPALVGGKILELRADEGETVAKGDTLAVLDTLELVLERRSLLASLRELEVQESLAKANLERAADDLSYARQRYERVRALHSQGAATDQSHEDAQNVLSRAQSAYQTAQLQLQAVRAKREQLLAQLRVLDKKIADSVILSPEAGVVTERFFEPGEAIAPYRPIFEVTRIDLMEVKIYVPEAYLPRVKPGARATVRADGLTQELEGTVAWISSKAEFTPRSILTPETRASLVYAVKIRVPNPNHVLKDGMPVEVVLR